MKAHRKKPNSQVQIQRNLSMCCDSQTSGLTRGIVKDSRLNLLLGGLVPSSIPACAKSLKRFCTSSKSRLYSARILVIGCWLNCKITCLSKSST